MGVAVRLVNFNEQFNTTTVEPVIVNNFDLSSQEQIDYLSSLIYTHYEGDSLQILPSCQSGCTVGEHNVGIRCERCGTIVMSVTERPLESILWIKPPKGVDTLINPQAWYMLNKQTTHNGVRLLEWLCNPTMQMPPNPPKAARKLQSLAIERGLNFFFHNFDEIMAVMFEHGLVTGTREQKDDLMVFIRDNREAIFAEALPIPSKMGFITEKTVNRTYADPTMMPAIDAVHTISGTENSPTPLSPKQVQARAVKAIDLLSTFHQNFIGESLGKKHGWFRKHVYGSRLHFTFRAVISSLSDNHHYDEIHLPWSVAVMVYQVHLTSLLMKMGGQWNPRTIMAFLREHTLQYHPLLDELFKQMINDSPYGGLPILLNRNPTLMRGSIQALRVTQVKTDPNINSISMSVLCLVAPNADFDGDALNGMLILDQKQFEHMQRLAPHHGVLDLTRPNKISRNIKLPPPVVSTMSAWVHEVQ